MGGVDIEAGTETGIAWDWLRDAARDAARRAYAPYSRVRVGAAGLAGDGRLITACNVENASYGVTLCAECGLVSGLHAGAASPGPVSSGSVSPGEGGAAPRLVAVAVVAGDGEPLLPCGRCRQLLLESGGPELLVDTVSGPRPLSALLPDGLSPADVAARRDG